MNGAGIQQGVGAERNGMIAWMARNPVAANLLMILLLVGGVGTALTMQKEVFPSFELDVVRVDVGYPGAAPAEVEQGIILPIEDAIRGVSGIKEITSEAREGGGRVSAELVTSVDRMQVFQDIDQAVNRIRTFPEEIDQPEVSLLARRQLVLNIVLYGEADRWTLRQLGERLRDRLLSDDRITQVELQGGGEFVTHIEIPSDVLREYGLTLQQVARLVEASSRDVAAGVVETAAGEILLRMTERKQWAQQIADIELLTSEQGSVVTLGQIAHIEDGFEEGSYPSRFNQQLSSQVNIFRVGTESPLVIAEAVQEIMAEVEQTLPPGIEWRVDSNAAEDFGERLGLLLKNGFFAILIVLCILALFLEMRLAFWVMMGMTISFVGVSCFCRLRASASTWSLSLRSWLRWASW